MTYKVELIPSEEGYSVNCPELPGCRSQGETEEEAIRNVREAIQEYLSVHPKDDTPKEIRFVEVSEASAAERPHRRVPFVVRPISMGLPPGGNYDKVEDLLDSLEGPYRR